MVQRWFVDEDVTGSPAPSIVSFARDTLIKVRIRIAGIMIISLVPAIAICFTLPFYVGIITYLFFALGILMMSLMVHANTAVGDVMENLAQRPWILWKPTIVDHPMIDDQQCAEFMSKLNEKDYYRFTSTLHMFRHEQDAVLFKLIFG